MLSSSAQHIVRAIVSHCKETVSTHLVPEQSFNNKKFHLSNPSQSFSSRCNFPVSSFFLRPSRPLASTAPTYSAPLRTAAAAPRLAAKAFKRDDAACSPSPLARFYSPSQPTAAGSPTPTMTAREAPYFSGRPSRAPSAGTLTGTVSLFLSLFLSFPVQVRVGKLTDLPQSTLRNGKSAHMTSRRPFAARMSKPRAASPNMLVSSRMMVPSEKSISPRA